MSFEPQKMNYILLMMVDKYVHWHVIPRYDGPRQMGGVTFEDSGWPRTPALTEATTSNSLARFWSSLPKSNSLAWS